MNVQVTDVPERQRFEAVVDGKLAGFVDYQKTAEMVVFTHTEVDAAFEGKGVGGALVRGALDHVRSLGLKVLPICPFAQAWLLRHPEYADLDVRAAASRDKD